MFIGITGLNAAGKTTAAKILEEKGFTYYSCSDIVREETKKKGLPLNRDNLIKVANDLRVKQGPGFLGRRIAQKIEDAEDDDAVIDSIRHPEEVAELKKQGALFLISMEAPEIMRYQRSQKRNKDEDNVSFAKFQEQEARELDGNEHEQQLRNCMQSADVIITNRSTLDDLRNKIDNLSFLKRREGLRDSREAVEEVENNGSLPKSYDDKREKRPSWDEYFLSIAVVVASRATCDRGKSGCVIVKNKQILTTGYVGSPVGVAHCDEIGHLMKTVTHDDGSVTQHCMRTTHAEQNAICQAAKLGVSLDGAALYCKMEPCGICAKMIINSGIKRVVCEKRYHAAQESRDLFRQAGIQVDVVFDDIEQYEQQ